MIAYQEYLIVFGVAAGATWLVTFLVRAMAKRHSLLVAPDEQRVHERPTPTAGGTAMYVGLLAAMAVASQIPAFAPVFKGNSAPFGVVLAATVMFSVGLADDVRELSPPAKLSGQVLAGTLLYFFGVSMLFFHVPLAQTTLVLSGDWAPLATVVWVAVMANAVNFIDGLDGLAAGIVAIGAGAFFIYSHQLAHVGYISIGNAGPLIAVVAVGLCVGFLPHNFHPARIFMGDTGAMLLGLLMAASTMAVVGQDPLEYSGRTYFFFAPVLIPFVILGIPMLDTAFAVVRRAGQRTSPAARDLNHLHHRLMRLGHGYRPTVLILWAWTALLSGIVLWPGITNSHNEIPPIAVGGLLILLYTLFAPKGRAGPAAANGTGAGDMNGAASAPAVGNGTGEGAGLGDRTGHGANGSKLTGGAKAAAGPTGPAPIGPTSRPAAGRGHVTVQSHVTVLAPTDPPAPRPERGPGAPPPPPSSPR